MQDRIAKTQIAKTQIEQQAYFLWLARGCPLGDPERDWLDAEAMLRNPPGTAHSSRPPYALKFHPQSNAQDTPPDENRLTSAQNTACDLSRLG